MNINFGQDFWCVWGLQTAVRGDVQVQMISKTRIKQRKGVLTAIGLEIRNKLFIVWHLSCGDTGKW